MSQKVKPSVECNLIHDPLPRCGPLRKNPRPDKGLTKFLKALDKFEIESRKAAKRDKRKAKT